VGLAVASFAAAMDAAPRVIGYERFYAQPDSDLVAAGQLLLGELNCTSCHAAEASLADRIQRKAAPVLDTVGSRVRSAYLLKFLADPPATKPGTTMPSVLAGLVRAERESVADALVHFLATTGSVTHANPLRQAVDRGEKLFHAIGCVACHDPRDGSMQTSLPTSIPLGFPSRKYTLPGLTQFLQDPLAVRPGGRMPHFNLTFSEARDIASFLLNDLDIVSGLQYAYYEGSWEKLPDFQQLTPVAVGDANDFSLRVAKRRDHFALRFEGFINIEQSGDYLFLIGSDDGSRLLVDDKLVVNNDGVHAFEQKRKRVKMTTGLHSVTIEYFEQEGEESLQVDFEGPGMTQQPLAALLTTPVTTKGTAPPPEDFSIDAAKAARGKEYFASLGCASCHSLAVGGTAIQSTKLAAPLAALRGQGGCLDQSNKSPRYGLSARQKESLTAAMVSAKQPRQTLEDNELVSRAMVRFNCYACHERNQRGGVEEARNVRFQCDTPEMGDEGRVPPSLTGVGAKLNAHWMRTLLEQGAKNRPYMLTRMPKFGLPNVGDLAGELERADAGLVRSAPAPNFPKAVEKRLKASARRLIGSQGFSCIKCHTFADKRSAGIQAISLTTMTQRLRRDWFHHYMQNPMAYRPGTRMPTPFPDGQTTLPMVLDGKVDTQIAAMWSYLADGERAIMPLGLVTGKIELVAFNEAVIYRNFIEGAGTRAIGVGYPEKLNLAFDANQMQMVMMWHGGFIDAARHWSARGAGFEGPLGDNVLPLAGGPPLAILADSETAWPSQSSKELGFRFRGYRLGSQQQPTFLYAWNGLSIEDFPRPVGADDVFTIRRTLSITTNQAVDGLWFRAARSDKIDDLGGGKFKIDDRWLLHVTTSGEPVMRKQDEQTELCVPVRFTGGKSVIELEYDW
jgi:mono/diheme cytochrome c family protein